MVVFFNGVTPDMECESITLKQGAEGIEIVLRNEKENVIGMYDFGTVRAIMDRDGVTHKLKLIP
jgi:hypothetical protein